MSAPGLDDLPPPPAGLTGWPWTRATPRARGSDGPRITVVTPSYRQGPFLEETIRSVLLQGYPDLEYIVIDGGSDDGSRAILDRYAPFLAGWRSAPDRGQAHALNLGFARATGEIRAYLNSDDLYEPGALRTVAEGWDPRRPWVAGRVRYLREGAGTWPVPRTSARSLADWFLGCPVSQPGSFWSAELQRAAGPFREELTFALDYDLWLRFRVDLGTKLFPLDADLAVFRLHPGSKTVGWGPANVAEVRRVRSRYERRLPGWRRRWIGLVRRHHRARYRGRRAASRLLDGEPRAAGGILAAVGRWPFVLADPTVYRAAWRLARAAPGWPPPENESDWEDVWGRAPEPQEEGEAA